MPDLRPAVRALALAALALAGLAAPAAAQDRAALLLSDRPPPREGCRVDMSPRRLPAFDEIADSAAVVSAVRAWAGERRFADADSIFLLVSVGWNRDGRPVRGRGIRWYLPEGAGEELSRIVLANLRPQRGFTNLRVRLVPGAEPRVQVGRAEVCPPLGLERVDLVAPEAFRDVSAPQRIRARVFVNAEGRSLGVDLLSRSGSRDMDDWVDQELRRRRFAPGLIDGYPADMEYEATIRFTNIRG